MRMLKNLLPWREIAAVFLVAGVLAFASGYGQAAYKTLVDCSQMPALTGGVTSPAGSCVTTWVAYPAPVAVPIRVVTGTGSVTVSATTDYFVCIKKSTPAATTVNLPGSPATGLTFVIKDCGGVAAADNNTITPASGNIDGAINYIQTINNQSTTLTFDGTQWEVN